MEEKKSRKVKFGDLSWPLKFAVVFAWIYAILAASAFAIGFIDGVLGSI